MTDASPIAVLAGAATDTGRQRRVNQDAHLAASPLFLVADGMGGHHAGEVASATVIAEFAQLAGRPSLTVDDVRTALTRSRRAVEELPGDVAASAGTTLAGVVVADVDGEGYWLALNLGDSRTYRLSDGELEQISVDHSVVQELVDSGQLDADAAASDSRRNVITRAIGAGSDGQADFWLLPAEVGDRILVCSDGLTGEVRAADIREILVSEPHPQHAAERLVAVAVEHGGRDNVTAVVVDAISVRSRSAREDGHGTQPSAAHTADVDTDTRPRARAGGR